MGMWHQAPSEPCKTKSNFMNGVWWPHRSEKPSGSFRWTKDLRWKVVLGALPLAPFTIAYKFQSDQQSVSKGRLLGLSMCVCAIINQLPNWIIQIGPTYWCHTLWTTYLRYRSIWWWPDAVSNKVLTESRKVGHRLTYGLTMCCKWIICLYGVGCLAEVKWLQRAKLYQITD